MWEDGFFYLEEQYFSFINYDGMLWALSGLGYVEDAVLFALQMSRVSH